MTSKLHANMGTARAAHFSQLKGKTLLDFWNDDDELIFKTNDLKFYTMYHDQDCCESVYIEDIDGDLEDLIGDEILLAEETSEEAEDNEHGESYGESGTWTFYKLSTIKASTTIRWLGQSNGYYSECVSFYEVELDVECVLEEPERWDDLLTEEERGLFLLGNT